MFELVILGFDNNYSLKLRRRNGCPAYFVFLLIAPTTYGMKHAT